MNVLRDGNKEDEEFYWKEKEGQKSKHNLLQEHKTCFSLYTFEDLRYFLSVLSSTVRFLSSLV